jgi:transcriptional regulator with GAF, ATPase, and Fis domain
MTTISLGSRIMTRVPRIAQRYDTLVEVNRIALTQATPENVFHGMCTALKTVFPYDRAGLMLYQPEEDALKIVALHGGAPESFFQIGRLLGTTQTPHGQAFLQQRIVLRRNLETERQFALEELTLSEGLRSYCAVPLVARGDSIGVVTILSFRKEQFSEQHASFLREVSNQIVLAVKTFLPECEKHSRSKLVCPKCIASAGGRMTTARYKEQLSAWGRQGGRGKKKKKPGN